MPISFVRALTENASTPAMPTAAMISASMPNDDDEHRVQPARRNALVADLLDRQHVLDRLLSARSTARSASPPARAPPDRPACESRSRRDGKSPCANGMNIAGSGCRVEPAVLRVADDADDRAPIAADTPMNFSTSPVHATRWPIGSLSGKNWSASVLLRITTRADVGASVDENSRPLSSGIPDARK